MFVTMTLRLCDYLARLTAIPGTKPRHHLWCSAAEFCRRNTCLDFELSTYVWQVTLPKFVSHLRDSPNYRVFSFVNHVEGCLKWSKKLAELLALQDISVFVLELRGEMDKNKNFTVGRLFTDEAHLTGLTPRALVAILAGDTGIDQRQFDMVGRKGLARDIITLLQGLGRNRRREGMHGRYLVYFSWEQMVAIWSLLAIVSADKVARLSCTMCVCV